MPVKRISLQFRTKSVVAQPAIPEPPTPPSSQESFSYPKAESLVKSRPSRLKPSVPLHMTTRRHKSELQSAHTQPQLSNNTSPTTTDIPENIIRKMPPKRKNGTISEYHDSDERLKKRLRGPKSNGASQSSISVDASNEENNTSREASKDTQIPPKRPRGRPPLKPRPSTSEKIDITIDAANSSRKESHIQDSELKSTVTSRAPSDIVRPKVPREELFGQYYRKQANALKHATTEQIRRRQAKLAAQYSTLAQLAKKNNTWLIDKSIDVLSNVKDVDLARTEWALSILEGLEKWEDARVEQINYEKRIGLLNAFHSYNAERDRLDTEFTHCFREIKEKNIGKGTEGISRIEMELEVLQGPVAREETEYKETEPIFSPVVLENPVVAPIDHFGSLLVLAQECEQRTHVQPHGAQVHVRGLV